MSAVLGLLRAERRPPNVSMTDRLELRWLLVEADVRDEGEGIDESPPAGDDAAANDADDLALGLAFDVLICLGPRDLKRAKADSADDLGLAVDTELLPDNALLLSSAPRFFNLRALCSLTSSRFGSVQTTSHMAAAATMAAGEGRRRRRRR